MSLARSLSRTALRVRIQRALTAACYASAFAGCVALVSRQASTFLLPCAAAALAFARPVRRAHVARLLDDACGLDGRTVAAVDFMRAKERSPFMEAALRDAERHVGDPARAAPLSITRVVALAALGSVLALRGDEVRMLHVRGANTQQVSSPREAPPRMRDLPARADAQAREQALRELRAREADQAAVTSALASLPIIAGRAGSASSRLRGLADAITSKRLSSNARAQLQDALARARVHEEQRRASTQPAPQERAEDRKLEQLQRPDPPPTARADDALRQGDDRQAARALRDAANALDQQQRAIEQQRAQLTSAPARNEVALAQFERVAGGGNERDSAEHAPSERRVGGTYVDHQLRGSHGEGPSRSQVIAGASQAGFASAPYRRVYQDYREHAEEVLARDEVPPGERAYVRRYFELVQPRQPEVR